MKRYSTIAIFALLAMWLSAAWPSSAAPTEPESSSHLDVRAADPETLSDYEAQVDEVGRHSPSLSREDAEVVIASQEPRLAAIEILGLEHAATYGGAWFDIDSMTQHVAMTEPNSVDFAVDMLSGYGVNVKGHLVQNSYRRLDSQAKHLESQGFFEMGFENTLASVEAQRNEIEVYTAKERIPELQKALEESGYAASVYERLEPASGADVCTSTYFCDVPLRSGIEGVTGTRAACTVGFALKKAGATDPARWFTSAGHCSPGPTSGEPLATRQWYHAGGYLGLTGFSCENCAGYPQIDIARVKIESAHVLGGSFGWMYNYASTNDPVSLNSTILVGQTGSVVCLKARRAGEISDKCGVVADLDDANEFHLLRISGYDSCPGDSGGVWFFQGSGRAGWGSLARSTVNSCHGDNGGDETWMTTVTDMYAWSDATSASTFRVVLQP